MQTYQAEICIGGLITNTVVRKDLTAAEIVILRDIHGSDAVRGIKLESDIKRAYQAEYDRLKARYGGKKLEKSFPGARPVLPEKLADVGILFDKAGKSVNETVAKGPNTKDRKTLKEQEIESKSVEKGKAAKADLGIDDEDEDGDDE